jgi:hypothetical protein
MFFVIGVSVAAYSFNFSNKYPLPIIDHISFDAKAKFIRDHVDTNEIDTIVVGSSLALNNVAGVVLEKKSKKCKHVLNLSAWSIDAPQVEQLLELVEDFPKLERIIYSGQFTSFNFGNRFKRFDTEFIKKYILNTLNPVAYASFVMNACKDISFCKNREKEWEEKYMDNTNFGYLNFDHTGSAPLHIYGKDIIKSRWTKTDGATQNPNALKALRRMAKKAQEKKIYFYLVGQPYRQAQIDKHPHIQNIMKIFPKNMKKLLDPFGGVFLNVHDNLHLSDDYFADRSHLNDKGSEASSEEIAKFIDQNENK